MESNAFPLLNGISWVENGNKADIRLFDHTTWKLSSNQQTDILISDRDDEYNILELLEKKPTRHLIGKSPDMLAEIGQTIQTIQSGGFWRPDSAFGKLEQSYEHSFASSEEIKNGIDSALEKIQFDKYFNSPIDIVRLLANELLMNAFYHGQDVNSDREKKIYLETPIPFEIGVNEKGILLRIIDRNGGFSYDKMLSSLARGFRKKSPRRDAGGGAGLGFYFVFKMANQVILNVTENEGSEIICLIDASRRYKQYMQRVSSLHYFLGK